MDAGKAAKITAVRSHVRKTSEKQIVLESPAKRLVPTTEPDRVLAFGSPERRSSTSRRNVAVHFREGETLPEDADDLIDEEDDSEHSAEVDCVSYWEQVLSVMNESDEDTQVAALLESTTRSISADAENAEEVEDIPLQPAERHPLPEDATLCAQESLVLRGLRGRKSVRYLCSGAMSNFTAIGTYSNQWDVALCGDKSHIFVYEGGVSPCMGVSLHTVPNQPNRILNIKDIHNVICDNDVHYFRTRLVEIEKTQNSHDGRVLPMPCILDVEQFCHERNLLLHGDGARLVNTSVTSGIPMDDLVPRSRSV
ncbi:hypothetical protein L916_20439 [Phytophthora nicotianae]|uniref:Aromatic amino acid beta-eliminating lyase/threonine aldolase domain-containing protein n=1 Tax=Phytophthora nicotianae TaxID=4792 RepID=W2HV94_PHYNI|nr:hypothetical protein L916_20439 [Phytophthora nicotianae]